MTDNEDNRPLWRYPALAPAQRVLGWLSEHGMGRALRHRNYRIFAAFGWLSTIGYWMQRIAIQWLAWELTGSFAWLGAVALAEAAALMVVMPWAGAVADRVDRLRMARWARGFELAVSVLLALVAITGHVTLEVLFGLVLLTGTTQGFWSPARMAIVPNLVPREDVPAALATGSMLFHSSHFVGPAVAGFIIARWGAGYAVAVNACTFILSLVMLSIVRLERQEHRSGRSSSVVDDLLAGLQFIRTHPSIRPLMLAGLVISVGLRAYRELMAGYADGVFGLGAAGLAAMASASGLGGLIAAVGMAAYARTHGLGQVLIGSMLLNAVVQLGFALAPSFQLAVIAAGGLGFLVTVAGMSAQILVQHAVPGEVRGRVMSLWGVLFFAGPSLGAWAIGAAAAGIGFRWAMAAMTAMVVLYLVLGAPRTSVLRQMESAHVDDERKEIKSDQAVD